MPSYAKLPAHSIFARAFRRTRQSSKGLGTRTFVRDGFKDAAELIGPLAEGDEICGLTNGQFSLVDILTHVLGEIGPAECVIATWTMGIYEADRAYEFVNDRRIRRIRFILDPNMFARMPELASVLVKGFGPDSFRAVNAHAKFFTARGERLAVCCRSSMNLNPNRRIESFDLSVDDAVTRFFETLADDVWSKVDASSRSQSERLFQDLLGVGSVKNPKRPNPFGLGPRSAA